MTIKRYRMVRDPWNHAHMTARDDGDFVRYNDHLALVAAAYEVAAEICDDEAALAEKCEKHDGMSSANACGYGIRARTPADAQAALTAIERAAYERGVRDALTEAIKEAKGSVTIGGQRFLTAKLDDLEPAFLALLTQEGR